MTLDASTNGGGIGLCERVGFERMVSVYCSHEFNPILIPQLWGIPVVSMTC